jgi:hypothetical protein
MRKDHLGDARRRCEDNIKNIYIYLKEFGNIELISPVEDNLIFGPLSTR